MTATLKRPYPQIEVDLHEVRIDLWMMAMDEKDLPKEGETVELHLANAVDHPKGVSGEKVEAVLVTKVKRVSKDDTNITEFNGPYRFCVRVQPDELPW